MSILLSFHSSLISLENFAESIDLSNDRILNRIVSIVFSFFGSIQFRFSLCFVRLKIREEEELEYRKIDEVILYMKLENLSSFHNFLRNFVNFSHSIFFKIWN